MFSTVVLPAPGRTENDAELVFLDGETDMVGGGDAGVAHLVIFADIVKGDKGGLLWHGRLLFRVSEK